MEKVKFVDPDTGESLAFFVVEETKVGGTHYLLATEEEGESSPAEECGATPAPTGSTDTTSSADAPAPSEA